jgi:hypothetical protein
MGRSKIAIDTGEKREKKPKTAEPKEVKLTNTSKDAKGTKGKKKDEKKSKRKESIKSHQVTEKKKDVKKTPKSPQAPVEKEKSVPARAHSVDRGLKAGRQQNTNGVNAAASTSTEVGPDASASGEHAIAVGFESTATNTASIAIGSEASSDHEGSVAIGFQASTNDASQFVVGSIAQSISNFHLGQGVISSSPDTDTTIHATHHDTDGPGTNLVLRSGLSGSASASGSHVRIAVPTIGSSFTAVADMVRVDGNGFGLPATGANARVGVATLTAGTVTITGLGTITANTIILLTHASAASTPADTGTLYISGQTAGTGFTINSTNTSDDSSVYWTLVEPF